MHPLFALAALQVPPMPPVGIPVEVVIIVKTVMSSVVAIALGIPVIRALSRRFLERPPVAPALPPDVAGRLQRIEQAVDAISIEVERISEGQRFTTKLLTEGKREPR